MSQSIMLIDSAERHRQIIRQFIGETHPEVELVEEEPTSYDQVAASVHWSDFDLLLIDNQLGDEDGLTWVERFKDDQDFPPVIFLSSTDSNSTGANKMAEAGLRLGAQGFLFKKQMDMAVFSDYLSAAMGWDSSDSTETADQPFHDSVELLSDVTPLSTPILKDTFHEMMQAKALLHGHDNWPFSVQDLQMGKAEFAGYRILRYLGKRDDIYTFVGHSITDKQLYAIKLIDPSQMRGDLSLNKICQNFDQILDWHHPHIVHWIDYKEVDGHLVIVQDLIQGEKLSRRLRKTGVTEEQAVSYVRQILQALSHLHHAGMRAGALSPENILFKAQDELVLTHFNNLGELLQSAEAQSQRTYHEALYLSPEMIQGQMADHRSDLYIVGVILYHMLAGKPPFDTGTTRAVLTDQVASPAPLLSNSEHPLNGLIQQLMEKSPGKRIQSADEALQVLDRLAGDV